MTKADKPRLGFIGTGTIAAAIIEGLSASGADPILVSPRNADTAAGLAARFAHVDVAPDNQAVLDNSDAVFLAVRPQIADAVLTPLRFRPDHRVISLIATVSLDRLRAWTRAGGKSRARGAAPPVAYGDGATALFPPDAEARALFDRLGIAVELSDESEFDIFTAATASMASYFAFAHTIASWMEHGGVEAGKARSFVAQMLKGLGHTALVKPQAGFGDLAAEHQTSGGINEQVFRAVTCNGQISALAAALDAVAARLREAN